MNAARNNGLMIRWLCLTGRFDRARRHKAKLPSTRPASGANAIPATPSARRMATQHRDGETQLSPYCRRASAVQVGPSAEGSVAANLDRVDQQSTDRA